MLIACLIVASLVANLLEVLLPGGLLGILAALCLIAATTITMQDYNFIAAILFFATTIIGARDDYYRVKDFCGHQVWKAFFLSSQIQGRSNKCQAKASIIGETGSTLTPMVPGGRVTINGKIFDAASSDGYIEANTPVKVISQDSFKLTIQKL